MKRANEDIRQYAKEKGVYLWEVAQVVGCNDGNFSRKMRTELDKTTKDKIICIIDNIYSERMTE